MFAAARSRFLRIFSAVILGLDPRIQYGGALFLADVVQADGWILGSSPRMTAWGAMARGFVTNAAGRRMTKVEGAAA